MNFTRRTTKRSRSPRVVLAALAAAAVVLAGCGGDGDDTATTEPEQSTTTTARASKTTVPAQPAVVKCPAASMAMSEEGTVEAPAGKAPTVALEVTNDAKAGHNVHVVTTNFTWAPEHASGEAVPGEGHAHVYVDGKKLMRLYEPWLHLNLEPGTHEVVVSLNANDHAAYTVSGEKVQAKTTIEGAAMSSGNTMDEGTVAADDPQPTISLTTKADAKAGCNVTIETANFTWAPEHASGEHVSGEGHAHLYVDGEKQGRLYGASLHLNLEPGTHEVVVSLNANNHAAYTVDGDKLEAKVTIEVE